MRFPGSAITAQGLGVSQLLGGEKNCIVCKFFTYSLISLL